MLCGQREFYVRTAFVGRPDLPTRGLENRRGIGLLWAYAITVCDCFARRRACRLCGGTGESAAGYDAAWRCRGRSRRAAASGIAGHSAGGDRAAELSGAHSRSTEDRGPAEHAVRMRDRHEEQAAADGD